MNARPSLGRLVPALIWRLRLALFLACFAVFCYGMFSASVETGLSFDQADKVLHLLAFTGLGLCSALAASGRRLATRVWPVLFVAAPLTEYLQHLLQPVSRTFSAGDIAANLAGTLLALLIWRLLAAWLTPPFGLAR
jgi:hypothetical protein